ncbi:calcium-activated chloride channel regulator 1-like [Watersipora subatra]|uniref:calcium-activated chloride channel regulator 1-like n=1 Tax=Watersipora subatra TaxID=2589382 RepID=UPI00355C7591
MTRDIIKISVFVLIVSVVTSSNIGNDRQDIDLSSNGGYTNILIGIDDLVPENSDIISKIQEYFTEASKILFAATNNRLYFENFTILVPENWTHQSSWLKPSKNETIKRARIVVAEANPAYGDEPYTLQPGGCGQEGDFIHFTSAYLTENSMNDKKYRPAKRIVKEFAKLRWGLFDENIPRNNKVTSRFYLKDGSLMPQGCIEGITFNFKELAQCNMNHGGAPPPPCDFNLNTVSGATSLLSYEYEDSVIEFCTDEAEGGSHNILSNNLHNSNCKGRSAWSVMFDHKDFVKDFRKIRGSASPPDPSFQIAHRRTITAPSTSTLPTTTITQKSSAVTTEEEKKTIFFPSTSTRGNVANSNSDAGYCSQDVVCLCLDVSGSMDGDRIAIMSEAVQLYLLSTVKSGTVVGIVSFSSYSNLKADMVKITDHDVRKQLQRAVPTIASGSTNIAAGINECQRILEQYTGGNIRNTRILLHSDGDGNVGGSIDQVIREGVILDTVLFGQGGYLANQAWQTGGQEYLASDVRGEKLLQDFYEKTASRFCKAESADALLHSDSIIIPSYETTYQGRVYFDVTIGLNTKMVFKYNTEVNVTVATSLPVTITEDPTIRTTIIIIEGQLEQYVDYLITKVNPSVEASITIDVTSSPVPDVQPIEVKTRVNENKIEFNINTELITYIGVFQGYSPVQQLNVFTILEDPTGTITQIAHRDDGTGKDSVPNDGIYTGFLPSHLIRGNSRGSYYQLSIDVSGEGVLPDQGGTARRRKRCVSCNNLGNVTRSGSGSLVVINNWSSVNDVVPPEAITDLTVQEASKESGLIELSWTAPGEDLNIGQVSGYEFGVGLNLSIETMVDLEHEAVLTNVSELLVEAGNSLRMQVNASAISSAMVGFSESANSNETYYFRVRAYDSKNNFANWSNPASASFVDPETMIILFAPPTTTPELTSSSMPSTDSANMTEMLPSTVTKLITQSEAPAGSSNTTEYLPIKPPMTIIGVSVGVAVFFALAAALGMYVCHVRAKKKSSKGKNSGQHRNKIAPMSNRRNNPIQVQHQKQPEHPNTEEISMSYYKGNSNQQLHQRTTDPRHPGHPDIEDIPMTYHKGHPNQQLRQVITELRQPDHHSRASGDRPYHQGYPSRPHPNDPMHPRYYYGERQKATYYNPAYE